MLEAYGARGGLVVGGTVVVVVDVVVVVVLVVDVLVVDVAVVVVAAAFFGALLLQDATSSNSKAENSATGRVIVRSVYTARNARRHPPGVRSQPPWAPHHNERSH
ncbi:MAG: hypothetical protein QOI95_3251 [Acidimicrobiaceae bacterium]|jgi:hypothetical protein